MSDNSITERMKQMANRIDFKRQSERENELNKTIKTIKGEIEARPDPPQQRSLFSFLPSNLARISPFFPMNRRQMSNRPYEELEWEHNWGRITIKGKRLSIYDETLLLSLLYLAAQQKSDTIFTTQYELCQIGNTTPCPDTYKAIRDGIERLAGTIAIIEVWEGKGRNRKLKAEMGGAIISKYTREEQSGKLHIQLNDYFLVMFAESLITNIDMQFRSQLKSDTAKALYRFYLSQRDDKFICHVLTIAKAVNLNIDQPAYKLREKLRSGLRELKERGFLAKWTLPRNSEILTTWKAKDQLTK